MKNWLDHIADKEFLQFNLTFCSLYIAVYEHITENVVQYVKSILCFESIKDGQLVYEETKNYKEMIRHRIVDSKGNKDITKASFLWLIDNGAMTEDDYQIFLDAKRIRNQYAHELFNLICTGLPPSDADHFFSFYKLYLRIVKWSFINIDAPLMGYDFPENDDDMDVQSLDIAMLKVILNVLYQDKSEEYKSIIAEFDET